jgi:hypothetical protein
MAQQTINIGTSANDGTGDTLRNAFDKTNDNFDELYLNSKSPIIISDYNGSTISGSTLNALIGSYLIPANTFKADDVFNFICSLAKANPTLGSAVLRVYTNTTSTLTGAVLLATYSYNTTATYFVIERSHIVNTSTSLFGIAAGVAAITDKAVSSNAPSTMTFNTTVDNYFLVSIQLGNASDSAQLVIVKLFK